jgi:hypothetical protein
LKRKNQVGFTLRDRVEEAIEVMFSEMAVLAEIFRSTWSQVPKPDPKPAKQPAFGRGRSFKDNT